MRLYTSMEAILTLIHIKVQTGNQSNERERLRERKKERETELRVTKETKCQKAIQQYFIGIRIKMDSATGAKMGNLILKKTRKN